MKTIPYRLLAVDVDGTIMNSRNQMPPRHQEALKAAHDAGLIVCPCTGRCLSETQRVIDALDGVFDAGIFCFGAIISDLPTGRTIYRRPLPPKLTQRLYDFFRGRDYPLLLLYDGAEAGIDYHFIPGKRNREIYEQWRQRSPAKIVEAAQWPTIAQQPVRIGILETPEYIDEVVATLSQMFTPQEMKFNPIYAYNYRVHVIECFAPEVNKWHGIQQLIQQLGFHEREVIAVGDDINDLEMIRHAGLGVAMGNAIPAIHEAARMRAPRHDDDGLAVAIERILAGKIEA